MTIVLTGLCRHQVSCGPLSTWELLFVFCCTGVPEMKSMTTDSRNSCVVLKFHQMEEPRGAWCWYQTPLSERIKKILSEDKHRVVIAFSKMTNSPYAKEVQQYLTQDINLSEEEDVSFLQLDWVASLLTQELEFEKQ